MYGLFRLVCWADCLYGWQYSPECEPPTAADYARAAIVFWGSLLTPLCIGLVAAVVAFRKRHPARWPWGELGIVGLPALVLLGGVIRPFWDDRWPGKILWYILVYANFLVGGAIVLALLNLGASLRRRKWGRLALSAVVFGAGLLYLFWLYAFIIYLDT
jgi:hypothetical protein